MAVTIKMVAEEAGVSTATVSRVINGETGIRDNTRETVLSAIEKTGFRLNSIARSLRTNKSAIIGLIAPEFTNEVFMKIARGIEEYIEKSGYSLIICNSDENLETEKKRIELLIEKRVDGVIIIPATNRGRHFSRFTNLNIPTVFVDRLVEDFNTDAVLVDNKRGVIKAINYFLENGLRRIAFIGGNRELTTANERYNGYIEALKIKNIPADEDQILFGDFHLESGYKLMKKLMESPIPPEAVFISNYYMHIGAMKYLASSRRGSGNHPVIGSFDDMEVTSLLGFTKVTVSQPIVEIGRKAAELLINRISGNNPGRYKTVRLSTLLNIYKE